MVLSFSEFLLREQEQERSCDVFLDWGLGRSGVSFRARGLEGTLLL